MATANSKFQEDLGNAFDLINRNFKIQNNRAVYINLNDLKHYNFEFDQFWKILSYLEEKHGLNFLDVESPSIPISSDVVVPGAVETFSKENETDTQYSFTVKLPDDFEQQYQKLSMVANKNNPNEKTEIFYSDQEGLYRYDGAKKLNYPISGNRAKLVQMLISSQNVATPADVFLKSKLGKNIQIISQAINEINEQCIKELKISTKMIENKGKGYFINTEKYKISK